MEKKMERLRNSRLIFLDSELTQRDTSGRSTVSVPAPPFSTTGGGHSRLTLLSFQMRRNFYNVTSANGIFYIYEPDSDQYFQVTVPPGSYTSMADLAEATSSALHKTLGGDGLNTTLVTFNERTRKMSFTLTDGTNDVPPNAYIVSFQSRSGVIPVNVTRAGFFNDSSELFGLVPSRAGSPVNAFGDTAAKGPSTFEAPYLAQLSTDDSVVLRSSLMTGNYQSTSFEFDDVPSSLLMESHILALFPLQYASHDDQAPMISFVDANNTYQLRLATPSLETVQFYLTDAKGRPLEEVYPGQKQNGALSYQMVWRWDHLDDEQPTAHGHTPVVSKASNHFTARPRA